MFFTRLRGRNWFSINLVVIVSSALLPVLSLKVHLRVLLTRPSSSPQGPSALSFSLLFQGHSLHATTLDITRSCLHCPSLGIFQLFLLHPRLWTPCVCLGPHLLECTYSGYYLGVLLPPYIPLGMAMWTLSAPHSWEVEGKAKSMPLLGDPQASHCCPSASLLSPKIRKIFS